MKRMCGRKTSRKAEQIQFFLGVVCSSPGSSKTSARLLSELAMRTALETSARPGHIRGRTRPLPRGECHGRQFRLAEAGAGHSKAGMESEEGVAFLSPFLGASRVANAIS